MRPRNIVLSMLLGLFTVFMPALSYAHAEHAQADIKLLRDAAGALQKSRPELAKGLNNYADRETEELSEKKEKEEIGEKNEPQEERGEHAKY